MGTSTMKLLLLAASLISLVTVESFNDGTKNRKGDLCDPNKIDEEQYCRCPLGKRISRFKSTHDNGPEDRIWNLECDAIPSEEMLFDEYQTEYNELDENSFLVGMESHHDNGAEDRIYRYFYQNSENWVLSKCVWETTNYHYDDDVDYKLRSDQVIAGVKSWHDNGPEDRKFELLICKLSHKCTDLKEMKLDMDRMTTSSTIVMAGQTTKDNLQHSEAGTYTATISNSKQESLGESYSFGESESSSHEIGFSLGVTASWSSGALTPGASGSVTAGFESTWKSTNSKSWERNQEKSIKEVEGFEMSFTDICPGNSYCVSQITMETGEAKIPYKITAYSKENDYTCTEEGILVIKNSWNLKSTVTSSNSKLKTCPLECSCKAWNAKGPDNCKWAAETYKLISSLALNSPERESYMSQFMKNTCNIPSNGVCCCGTEEKPPQNSMDKDAYEY